MEKWERAGDSEGEGPWLPPGCLLPSRRASGDGALPPPPRSLAAGLTGWLSGCCTADRRRCPGVASEARRSLLLPPWSGEAKDSCR